MAKNCCGLNFMKNILNIFNIIFLIAGFGVLGVAIWTITDRYQYVALLTSDTYKIIVYFLLSAGALVIFTSFLGCFAVLKEKRVLLIWFIFLLVLIFLIEAMVGILAYIYEENVETELQMNLNNTFLQGYKQSEDKTAAVDFLQENFKCCGAVSFTDWKYSEWLHNIEITNKVPDSCCKSKSDGCGVSVHPSNINYSGCLQRMAIHMEDHLVVLSAVGLGICVLQIFGVVLAFKLYLRLKSNPTEEHSDRNTFI